MNISNKIVYSISLLASLHNISICSMDQRGGMLPDDFYEDYERIVMRMLADSACSQRQSQPQDIPMDSKVLLGKQLRDATEACDVAGVRALIAKGAPTNEPGGINGWTPLHLAAFNGNKEIVEILLDSGIPYETICPTGYTPSSVASIHGFLEIKKLIESKNLPIVDLLPCRWYKK